ncbi:Fe-S cluster assembly protein SufD [Paenibacillus pasadenensis]|uniref:Iron-sulfur cluster assembly protein SufD n=1 Tax=Paenibacillus pasadenensis TaxID=217090 RepID=A0A2N5N9U2_9BACL|nr:Fe-S cluster assembly protein SufD [Paenibacillus pasadenensis]PLT47088.1 Iron-sulfur cluster assembly protein SufD [Paenibacillus pasadenensis]
MSTQLDNPVGREFAEALSRSKGEPAWLTSLRGEAAELAESLEWPKPEKIRIDRWNLTAFGEYAKPQALSSESELPEAAASLVSGDGALLVQRGSGTVLRRLPEELSARGVIFTDLETAAAEHPELVQKHLFQAIAKDENKLTALHAALWNGGVFLYVPKEVEIDVPLQALFYNDDASVSFAPHILIVAERHSRVTYVDNALTIGGGADAVHHSMIEVIAGDGAKVDVASIHQLGANVIDTTIRRAVLGSDARIQWVIGDLNDGNVLSDTLSVLKGNGSSSDAAVVSIGAGKQRMSLTTQAKHFGLNSDSNMVTRAVMKEEATAIINGITKIEKGATKANGVQTEKVLMLSPKARGDANPILLIDEDDVTAGHAASVGQVNPEQVYYLMSRGVTKAEAERLIIYGFLAPVVTEVPIDAVREQLQQLLERKLEA